MKRDVKSLLSVSLAIMKLPSPIMNASLALPFDIRVDESTSTTFDVFDDSIPIVERRGLYEFISMARRTFLIGMSFLFTAAHQLTMTADLVYVSWYTFVLPLIT
jgi:hypothetical protein